MEVQPSAFNEKKKNKCLFFIILVFEKKKWIFRSFWLSYRHNRKNKHVRFHPSSSFSIACYRSLIERFFMVFFSLLLQVYDLCADALFGRSFFSSTAHNWYSTIHPKISWHFVNVFRMLHFSCNNLLNVWARERRSKCDAKDKAKYKCNFGELSRHQHNQTLAQFMCNWKCLCFGAHLSLSLDFSSVLTSDMNHAYLLDHWFALWKFAFFMCYI